MRDILFRAKRKDNWEWVEGYYALIGKRHTIIRSQAEKYYTDEVKDSHGNEIIEIIPETLCQYTGLTDCNGNRIWENDIVKEFNAERKACSISKIVFSDYSLNLGWCSVGIKSLFKHDKRVFNVGFGENGSKKCVVIGNVFDNADLLKESEDK